MSFFVVSVFVAVAFSVAQHLNSLSLKNSLICESWKEVKPYSRYVETDRSCKIQYLTILSWSSLAPGFRHMTCPQPTRSTCMALSRELVTQNSKDSSQFSPCNSAAVAKLSSQGSGGGSRGREQSPAYRAVSVTGVFSPGSFCSLFGDMVLGCTALSLVLTLHIDCVSCPLPLLLNQLEFKNPEEAKGSARS